MKGSLGPAVLNETGNMETSENIKNEQARILITELDADLIDIELIKPYQREEPDEATKEYWARISKDF